MDCRHLCLGLKDFLSPMKHNSSSKVDWHEGRGAEEKVVQPDHVAVVREYMAEPGNQPGQSKDGTKLSSLHMCVQGWPRPLHKWVHQLQQGHCLLHGGSHELLEVRNGKALHDVKGEFLPDYQKKCDGNIVIALVVVETGLSQKNPVKVRVNTEAGGRRSQIT